MKIYERLLLTDKTQTRVPNSICCSFTDSGPKGSRELAIHALHTLFEAQYESSYERLQSVLTNVGFFATSGEISIAVGKFLFLFIKFYP